jgi:hypothetical protein
MEQFFYSNFLKFQKKYTEMLKNGSVAKNIFRFNESTLIIINNSTNKPRRRMAIAFNVLFILRFTAPTKSTNCDNNPTKIIGWVKLSRRFSVLENISNNV